MDPHPNQNDVTLEDPEVELGADDFDVVEFDNDVAPEEDSDNEQDAGGMAVDDEEQDQVESRPIVMDNSATTIEAHADSVYCVALSKDGQFVVSGGGDDKATVSSASSGQLTLSLEGHSDSVVSVKLNHDESLIATGSYDSTVRIWNSTDGSLVKVLEGPGSEIEWICWHPVGDVLLAGSADATAWMWNARTGDCMAVLAGHEAPLTCGSFTVNGKRILTGSLDATVKLWDPRSSTCMHTFSGHQFHQAGVVSLALHHDQPMIAAGGQDGTLRIARLESKKIVATFRHSVTNHDITIAGADTGESEEEMCSIESCAFIQTQPWVLSGGTDGKIKVWDLHTLNCRYTFSHQDSVVKLVCLPDSTAFLSASLDQTLKFWDARSGEKKADMTGHTNSVLDFDVNSGLVVSASDDKTCKVFLLDDLVQAA